MRKTILDNFFNLNASGRKEEEKPEKLRRKIPFAALSLAVSSSPIIPSCELTIADNRQKLKDKT